MLQGLLGAGAAAAMATPDSGMGKDDQKAGRETRLESGGNSRPQPRRKTRRPTLRSGYRPLWDSVTESWLYVVKGCTAVLSATLLSLQKLSQLKWLETVSS